jgi:hypothetical protein
MKETNRIQVYCRIRPLLFQERDKKGVLVIEPTSRFLRILYRDVTVQAEFDRIMGEDCGQKEFFEAIKSTVLRALDGENCTIMAYGHTGSGKSYTILGPTNPKKKSFGLSSSSGIVPRTLCYLFEQLKGSQKAAKLVVSAFEIFNERIVDLLDSEGLSSVSIKEDRSGEVHLAGLKQFEMSSLAESLDWFEVVAERRSQRSTQFNEESSRSHTLVRIKVGAGSEDSAVVTLVDLAGSERFSDEILASKGYMQENRSINQSLAVLGR